MGKRREPTEAEKIEEQRKIIREAIEGGKTELDLRTQSMDVLREACAVKTLTKLTLRNMGPGIKTLPREIGNLTELESLHFDSNELTSLPDEIGKLSKLHTLYGYSNKLTSLPDSIGDLKSLTKLTLWSNELKALPPSFGRLKKLTECELKWNKLKSLPDEIAGLEALEELDLTDNELSDLPHDLSGMVKLHRLALEDNNFKELPAGVLTLPALVELNLSENKLTSLPDDIARITTLRELNFDENALTDLPKKLFSLPLTTLNLKKNKLKALPPEIASMRSLLELTIYENPIPGGVAEDYHLEGKAEILAKLGMWKPKVVPPAPAEPERAAIVKQYAVKLEKFAREAKKRSSGEKWAAVLAFIKGQGTDVPPPSPDDESHLAAITEVLSPRSEWTFIDRRILAFITQDAWRFKQPGHDYFNGFDEPFYKQLKEQMKEEAPESTLFADAAKDVLAEGIPEELFIEGALRELDEAMLREDKLPTSFGKYLIEIAPRHEKLIAAQSRGSVKEALIGLLVRHARDFFMRVGDKLLVIAPDEDGETHVPYEALDHACAVDPARYEKLLLTGLEKTDCDACRAEAARVLHAHYPKHKALALEVAKRTLKTISERKNKEERFSFYWSVGGGGWEDGTARYVAWVLDTYGDDVKADVNTLVENTKVFDIEIAEVLAKKVGQPAMDMLAEGLKMDFDDDEIAEHFRRLFALLAPLDWSKYYDKAWELARSEHRKVSQTACQALSRLDAKVVVAKAKELLQSKRGHEREAGVYVLTLVNDAESKKVLSGLLDTEKSDDARDLIVEGFYKGETKCDRKMVDARVASAEARGKLDKPAAKWIDEKKLPKLVWKLDKKPLDPLAVRFLFYRQTRQTEIAIDPEAHGPLDLIDRAKSGDFAEKLLALILKNGGVAAKNRFALALVGSLGDERVIPTLQKLATDDRNENAARTLGFLQSMDAARALDRIMKVFRVKYPNVREAAQEAFDSIAERLGKTPFELADSMIPDFGFVKGRRKITGTKPELFATIGPEQKLVVDKPKTLPAKAKEEIKALGEELRDAVRQLKANLEYYLIVRRRWEPTAWAAFFEQNPLAFSFAQGFVWGVYKSGKLASTFRVTADRERVGQDGKLTQAAKDAEIGLVHPLETDASDRAKWLSALATAGAKPAFPQLDRPTFSARDDERERAKCFRFEDRELVGLTFKGRAERRGWRRGSVVDSGEVSSYRKVFPHDKVEVFIGTEGLNVQSGYDDGGDVTLKDLFFVRPGAVTTGSYTYDEPRDESDDRLIRIGDVPPIVFSEAVADLAAITKEKEESDA